jgi:membrane-associated phospholipid phosphatase
LNPLLKKNNKDWVFKKMRLNSCFSNLFTKTVFSSFKLVFEGLHLLWTHLSIALKKKNQKLLMKTNMKKESALHFCYLLPLVFLCFFFDESVAIYIKNLPTDHNIFFQFITEFGDSVYYFIIGFITIIITATIVKKSSRKKLIQFSYLLASYAFVIISVNTLVGLLAQIFKHLIGRGRPKLVLIEGAFKFKIFSFKSIYTSMPSGHSVTVFSIALLLSVIKPKIKFIIYQVAALVALSRLSVQAHYLSDIVLGALIGTFASKIILIEFASKDIAFKIENFNLRPKGSKLIIRELFYFFEKKERLYSITEPTHRGN